MAETLSITIQAKDGATQVFQAVASSAKTMGQAVEQAGNSGGGFQNLTAQVKALDAEIQTVGRSMLGLGTAMTGALAVPMALGTKAAWDQVDAVQQATVALRAYEQDASKVDAVLESLVAYARSDMGVLFQRQDLFAAAQGLKVMGAETENLVEYVEIMSRSVAIGAGSWAELEQVIGRVGSTGQLTGVEFDNLTKMGFQLDNSLRNTTVTWEELFDALNQGIPEVGGALDTIEGQTIRFQSALRGLGLAFLQVDADTSQFIEGGLGDRLYNGIGQATELLQSMQPAAMAVGEAAALAAQGVGVLVSAFVGLPESVQTFAVMMTGFSGAALMAGGSMLLLVPKVVEFRNAVNSLRASHGILARLAMGAGPLTLALGAAAAAGFLLYDSFKSVGEEARNLDAAIAGLGGTLEELRLSGETGTAARVETVLAEIEGIKLLLEASNLEDLNTLLGTTFESALDFDTSAVRDDLARVVDLTDDTVNKITANLQGLNTAQKDAYLDWIVDMIHEAETTMEDSDLDDRLEEILLTPASEVPGVMDAATASIDGTADAIGRVQGQGPIFSKEFLDSLLGSDDALERLDERFEALAERQQEWIASALGIMGLDDPLSQWNLSGNASDAAELANNLTDAGTAADTMFRVIVGNTNAIKSQADATLNWAETLINVRGELGRIDDLVEKGLITGTSGVFDDDSQYAKAQDAYDSIADSVLRINDNLDAVQAIQAPLMAEMTASTANYTDELLKMPPAQQMVALAWMDTATAAQAMEITTLGAAAAAGDLGVNGMAAFESMAIGAANANPAIAALLVDMEVLEEHIDSSGNKTYTVNTEGLTAAQSELDMLNTTLGHLIDTLSGDELGTYQLKIDVDTTGIEEAVGWVGEGLGDITLPVDADTAPFENSVAFVGENIPPVEVPVTLSLGEMVSGAAGFVGDAVGGALGGIPEVTVAVTQTGAEETQAALDEVTASAQAIPEAEILNVIIMGANEGTASLNAVTAAAQAIPEAELLNVIVMGAGEAVAALNAVAYAAASIPESVSTTITTNRVTTNRVTTNRTVNLGSNNNVMPGGRHGGIMGYAMGGVPFIAGEAGPEMAYFANGGMAALPTHDIYVAPPNTYVQPHNALNTGGAAPITINVNGPVFGIDDLTEKIMREMGPAIETASRRQARSMGGR